MALAHLSRCLCSASQFPTTNKWPIRRGGAWHPQLVKRIVERLGVNKNIAAKSGY
jgi:hypothetical protein